MKPVKVCQTVAIDRRTVPTAANEKLSRKLPEKRSARKMPKAKPAIADRPCANIIVAIETANRKPYRAQVVFPVSLRNSRQKATTPRIAPSSPTLFGLTSGMTPESSTPLNPTAFDTKASWGQRNKPSQTEPSKSPVRAQVQSNSVLYVFAEVAVATIAAKAATSTKNSRDL